MIKRRVCITAWLDVYDDIELYKVFSMYINLPLN